MTWTEEDKKLLEGACADGARWALTLPGPQAVLDSDEHLDWTEWLIRRYVILGRELPEGLTVGGGLDLRGTPLGDGIGAKYWMPLAEVRARISIGSAEKKRGKS